MCKKNISSLVASTAELLRGDRPVGEEYREPLEKMNEIIRQMHSTCSGLACSMNIEQKEEPET
jgi:hypothetical protein